LPETQEAESPWLGRSTRSWRSDKSPILESSDVEGSKASQPDS